MRPLKIFSLLFAMTFALALTLPAFSTDTGQVPKTEKLQFNEKAISFQAPAVIHQASDVGNLSIASHQVNAVHADVPDLPVTDLYLDRPERPVTEHWGYIIQKPTKGNSNKIRPPDQSYSG